MILKERKSGWTAINQQTGSSENEKEHVILSCFHREEQDISAHPYFRRCTVDDSAAMYGLGSAEAMLYFFTVLLITQVVLRAMSRKEVDL